MSTPAKTRAGTIKTVWRYPVKSMIGEEVVEARVDAGGILGDRAYAVIDLSNGKVASAKYPKKWGQLLEFSASLVEAPHDPSALPGARVTWPTGAHGFSQDCDLDARLSETLGRKVTLTTVRPDSVSLERLDPLAEEETIVDIGDIMLEGRFSDYAAFHLLTTATLAKLSQLCPGSRFEAVRFRPNLLIETSGDQEGFVENTWVGRMLFIGEDVRLRVTDPTPRCSVPTLAQAHLPKDPEVLRSLVRHNQLPVALLDGETLPCAGTYAFVEQGGLLRQGDPVRIV